MKVAEETVEENRQAHAADILIAITYSLFTPRIRGFGWGVI